MTHDFDMFKELFDYDFSWLEKELLHRLLHTADHYQAIRKKELMYNKNVSEKVRNLSEKLETAESGADFFQYVTEFYKDYGVGMFGLNKAFRIAENKDGSIRFLPINNMDTVMLDDLIGYELQKKKLVENTQAFCDGKAANNVLLFGDSGTGKSTSIKAIVNQFYPQGLRMIEIYKHQFKDLSTIIAQIKNRNYKFIIYMDDLSFEEFEIEYKFLKGCYRGRSRDKAGQRADLRHIQPPSPHQGDVEGQRGHGTQRGSAPLRHMEEKLSLVNRFGLSIFYAKPNKEGFNEMAVALARRAGITPEVMTDEEICYEANRFEMRGGGLSGRTAQQFANYLLTIK